MASGAPSRWAAGPNARVLVVEDEVLIAILLEQMLAGLGFTPVGPAHSIGQAAALVASERLDAAVLDLALGDGATTVGIAALLEQRDIPFIVVTGHSQEHAARLLPGHPVLAKPFSEAALRQALERILPRRG